MTAGQPRNPFRSEADAFRIVAMIVAAAAIVIGLALLVDETVGAVAGLILVAVGAWRAGSWLRYWLGSRSED